MIAKKDIARLVKEFLADSDAVSSVKGRNDIPWRVEILAKMAFYDSVHLKCCLGYILFFHDGCSLLSDAGADNTGSAA